MTTGHIYILLNPTMPTYLKIGMTSRTPEERARELSQATGVPVPYTVAYSEEVINCEAAESMVHSRLAKFRVNRGREFFHLPLRDAIRELSEIAQAVGRPEIRMADPALAQSTDELVDAEVIPAMDLHECAPLVGSGRQRVATFAIAPSEQELVGSLSEELQKIYVELRKRVLEFGADVETYATRTNKRLIFKTVRRFAEIHRRRGTLRFHVAPEGFNIPENESADIHGDRDPPPGFARLAA